MAQVSASRRRPPTVHTRRWRLNLDFGVEVVILEPIFSSYRLHPFAERSQDPRTSPRRSSPRERSFKSTFDFPFWPVRRFHARASIECGYGTWTSFRFTFDLVRYRYAARREGRFVLPFSRSPKIASRTRRCGISSDVYSPSVSEIHE